MCNNLYVIHAGDSGRKFSIRMTRILMGLGKERKREREREKKKKERHHTHK
jgi:hypothetical protein